MYKFVFYGLLLMGMGMQGAESKARQGAESKSRGGRASELITSVVREEKGDGEEKQRGERLDFDALINRVDALGHQQFGVRPGVYAEPALRIVGVMRRARRLEDELGDFRKESKTPCLPRFDCAEMEYARVLSPSYLGVVDSLIQCNERLSLVIGMRLQGYDIVLGFLKLDLQAPHRNPELMNTLMSTWNSQIESSMDGRIQVAVRSDRVMVRDARFAASLMRRSLIPEVVRQMHRQDTNLLINGGELTSIQQRQRERLWELCRDTYEHLMDSSQVLVYDHYGVRGLTNAIREHCALLPVHPIGCWLCVNVAHIDRGLRYERSLAMERDVPPTETYWRLPAQAPAVGRQLNIPEGPRALAVRSSRIEGVHGHGATTSIGISGVAVAPGSRRGAIPKSAAVQQSLSAAGLVTLPPPAAASPATEHRRSRAPRRRRSTSHRRGCMVL